MNVNNSWLFDQIFTAINGWEVYPEGSKKKLTVFQRSKLNFAIAMRDMNVEESRDFVLSKVCSVKDLQSEALEINKREVGRASSVGLRETMEDADLAQAFEFKIKDQSYTGEIYAVFDGHRGDSVANFVKENIVEHLITGLEKCETLDDEAIWDMFKTSFDDLNELCETEAGSTAAVAVILNGKLWVANVGDSRVIINHKGKPRALTEDADPLAPRYHRKLLKLGSRINEQGYVDKWIGMARAFGDRRCPGVRATPKISFFPLKNFQGGEIVVATDGLFDAGCTVEIADAVETLKGKSAEEMAKLLIDSAINSGSKDNISVIVVKV